MIVAECKDAHGRTEGVGRGRKERSAVRMRLGYGAPRRLSALRLTRAEAESAQRVRDRLRLTPSGFASIIMLGYKSMNCMVPEASDEGQWRTYGSPGVKKRRDVFSPMGQKTSQYADKIQVSSSELPQRGAHLWKKNSSILNIGFTCVDGRWPQKFVSER